MTKDFSKRESEIREEIDPYLSVRDVRHVLGCSARVVVELIKSGELEAIHLDSSLAVKDALTADTQGLRIAPSSLKAFTNKATVK